MTWPDMTAWATRSSSRGLVFQPPLMAALQAMVCSSSSRAAPGSAVPVVSSFWAISVRVASMSPGSTSKGAWRTTRAPPPKSSTPKPNSSSRGRWESRAACSSGARRHTMGERRVWAMGSYPAAFIRSKFIRSWAACLSMNRTLSPCSTMM